MESRKAFFLPRALIPFARPKPVGELGRGNIAICILTALKLLLLLVIRILKALPFVKPVPGMQETARTWFAGAAETSVTLPVGRPRTS